MTCKQAQEFVDDIFMWQHQDVVERLQKGDTTPDEEEALLQAIHTSDVKRREIQNILGRTGGSDTLRASMSKYRNIANEAKEDVADVFGESVKLSKDGNDANSLFYECNDHPLFESIAYDTSDSYGRPSAKNWLTLTTHSRERGYTLEERVESVDQMVQEIMKMRENNYDDDIEDTESTYYIIYKKSVDPENFREELELIRELAWLDDE